MLSIDNKDGEFLWLLLSTTNIDSTIGALEMYNQGLAIREKMLGKEHPDTAESHNNIGLLYQAMGNTVDALEMPNHQGLAMNEIVYTLVSSHLRVRRT